MKINSILRKKFRIKNKLKKVASVDRFRLCVTRSTKNISAQVIDDKNNKTLFSASSVEKEIRSLKMKNKTEVIRILWGMNAEQVVYNFNNKKCNIYNIFI